MQQKNESVCVFCIAVGETAVFFLYIKQARHQVGIVVPSKVRNAVPKCNVLKVDYLLTVDSKNCACIQCLS
jgi:hypothetical protein